MTYISKRKKVGGGTRENRVSGCSDRGFLGSKIPEKYMTSPTKNMTPPENYGAVAPLTYISKRKNIGGGTRENRASGCSDCCFLGSKILENI